MKASGSYPSLVRGVSQETPSQRGPGRMEEQVNMVPDPVIKLCRRYGSLWQTEIETGVPYASLVDDFRKWRTFEYSHDGSDYSVMHRTETVIPGSRVEPLLVYNQTYKQFLSVTRNAVDPALDLLYAGGVSAIVNVGKYLFIAGNTIVPTASTNDLWGATGNQNQSVVWIRGGAYSRTYKVVATRTDGVVFSFQYTTPTSSYQGTLDTSPVPVYAKDPAGGTQVDTEAAYIVSDGLGFGTTKLGWAAWSPTGMTIKDGGATMTNVSPANPAAPIEYSWAAGAPTVKFHATMIGDLNVTMSYTHDKTVTNPNYSKQVADITNAYNSAVTQWIGTSATALAPAAIAEQLRLAAVAAGLTGGVASGSSLYFTNVKGLTVTDGGDGSLIRGVANEISSIDQVTDAHFVNKVVKVRAKNSQEALYLKATAKDPTIVSGFTEVIWVEGAGKEFQITSALVYGTVSAGSLYLASSAALLAVILPGTHPDFAKSTVGDENSSPLPYFIGKKITYLGMFQDRLEVGAGAVVRESASGDYLNFFRSSVTTVVSDDSLEMLSQGVDDDTLRFPVLYDRDRVIFGDKRQYAVSGRSALTPASAVMPVISNHRFAATSPPLAVGGKIYYLKRGPKASSLHQIQPGLNVESPDSFDSSSQLNEYINGQGIEITSNADPSVLFVRTKESRNDIYVFHYLDTEQGRQQDAWHRWSFNPALGEVIGMSGTADGLLVFFVRQGDGKTWYVADLVPMDAGLSPRPYLDSQRTWEFLRDNFGSVRIDDASGQWAAAWDDSSEFRFLGGEMGLDAAQEYTDRVAAGANSSTLIAGCLYDSYFTPTNPYMRDREDKAITTGRLTVGKLHVSFDDSSGFTSVLVDKNGTLTVEFNGRILKDPNNILGREVVTTGKWSIPIAREINDYAVTIHARSWLPLTVSNLEWVGQVLNNVQRF